MRSGGKEDDFVEVGEGTGDNRSDQVLSQLVDDVERQGLLELEEEGIAAVDN